MNTIESYFNVALWLAAIGHFCVLGASFQVPARLKWKEDLDKLLPLNRKLMWTYGFFTVGCIIGFGLLTFFLHDELLRGDRSALGIALFIGIFWMSRLCVDFFYFSHNDWPQGLFFKVGHGMLVFLFICLVTTYLGLFTWHMFFK